VSGDSHAPGMKIVLTALAVPVVAAAGPQTRREVRLDMRVASRSMQVRVLGGRSRRTASTSLTSTSDWLSEVRVDLGRAAGRSFSPTGLAYAHILVARRMG
jgi:hypothetical protein